MNDDISRIRAYLLGRLDVPSAESLEAQVLADEDFYQAVRGVEDDLVDGYARGSLAPEDQKDFAKQLEGQPDLRERVAMARSFHAARRRGRAMPAWVLPSTIAAAVLLAIGIGLWSSRRVHPSKPEILQAQQQPPVVAPVPAVPVPAPPPSPPAPGPGNAPPPDSTPKDIPPVPTVVTWLLAADINRGAGPDAVERPLPTSADQVALVVDLGGLEPAPHYRIRIPGPLGKDAWMASDLQAVPTADGNAVKASVPASVLRGRSDVTVVLEESFDSTWMPAAEIAVRLR